MASFSRLVGLASRAVQKMTSDSTTPGSGPQKPRDWRAAVRQAADSVTRERQATDSTTRKRQTADTATRDTRPTGGPSYAPPAPASGNGLTGEDRAAIARYDYLVQTAAPDEVERMHREAFERLSPTQRAQVRARMDAEFGAAERPRSESADDLARAAGRAEAHRPGRMRGLLARATRGGGGAGLFAAVAGGAVAGAVAAPLLAEAARAGVDFAGLAAGVDLEGMASGIDLGVASEWTGGAQEAVSGVGDQLGGLGEQLSNVQLPGLGDLFGR